MNDLAQQRIAPAAIRKTLEVKAPIDRAFRIFAGRASGGTRSIASRTEPFRRMLSSSLETAADGMRKAKTDPSTNGAE